MTQKKEEEVHHSKDSDDDESPKLQAVSNKSDSEEPPVEPNEPKDISIFVFVKTLITVTVVKFLLLHLHESRVIVE